MKSCAIGLAALLMAASVACSKPDNGLQIPAGSDVTVEKRDGVTISGRLVEVQAQEVILESRDGQRTRVARSEIVALRGAPSTASTPSQASASSDRQTDSSATARAPERPASPRTTAANGTRKPAPMSVSDRPASIVRYREVTVPAGTVMPIELRTTVGSETSEVEDQVRGTLRKPVMVEGEEAIPAGATVIGTVTEAERSGRVKGLARVAFRFSSLDLPGDAERVSIRTAPIEREAEATKKKDAAKIGGGAAAGAVIGGIIGGGDGAAKGAAIGGAAGTGVVLSTRGKEVTLPAGTNVSARLLEPVTLRVRLQ